MSLSASHPLCTNIGEALASAIQHCLLARELLPAGRRFRPGVNLPMRRRDPVPARQNLFRTLRLADGIGEPKSIQASSALLSARRVDETEAARIETGRTRPDAPPVAAAHELDRLLVCRSRVQAHRKAALWGGTSEPRPAAEHRVHQAVELALTKPSDLPAPTANELLWQGLRGNDVVARAKGFDGHLFHPCRLGAGTALDNLLRTIVPAGWQGPCCQW